MWADGKGKGRHEVNFNTSINLLFFHYKPRGAENVSNFRTIVLLLNAQCDILHMSRYRGIVQHYMDFVSS